MENKKAVILVFAIAATVLITASWAYATMSRQPVVNGGSYPSSAYGYGIGLSMMGGFGGPYGGMMGSRGMMGTGYGQSMMENMQQYMWHYWNSTSAP